MARSCIGLLLYALAHACPVPSGSPASPFLVDTAGTVRNCTSFASLQAALLTGSDLPLATIAMRSSAQFPPWTVHNSITLIGEAYTVDITGVISVSGALTLTNLQLLSYLTAELVIDVAGEVAIDTCEMAGFTSLPIHIKGKVSISNSVFRNNARGVFASFGLGGNVYVTDSEFYSNAKGSGAVFYIYPLSGSEAAQCSINHCKFERNGVQGGNSVLFLNDMATNTTANASFAFFECTFKGHPSATFQVTSRVFAFSLSTCQFEGEFQVLIGAFFSTNATFYGLSVNHSIGPLFLLQVSGEFNLINSNFTYIQAGPLLVVRGSGVSTALIHLSQVHLTNISTLNSVTQGNLINAIQATIWLERVTIRDFRADNNGVFLLLDVVLFTQSLVALNGTATGLVVGMMTTTSICMNDTYIEKLNSQGTMAVTLDSSVSLSRISYSGIEGIWQPIQQVYSTNLFTFQMNSQAEVDTLSMKSLHPGFPLFFLRYSNMTLSNSLFSGPLGMALISTLSSRALLRNITLNVPSTRGLFSGIFSAYIEVDNLVLRDLTSVSSLIRLSAGSEVYIKQLSMVNVTSLALSRGFRYKITIDEVRVEKCNIGALVYFSVGV